VPVPAEYALHRADIPAHGSDGRLGVADHYVRGRAYGTVSFAALNIADTTAARASTVTERAALTARIERLRSKRGGITESRSVAAIEAELQRAQPSAATVDESGHGCFAVAL
jgi:hypothetical protein